MLACFDAKVWLNFLPPHTSQVLQPLDLGPFSVLKRAYRRLLRQLCAESLTMAPEGPFGGQVKVVEHLGGETLVYVDVGDGHLVTVKTPGSTSAQIGERVRLAVNTEEARLFDKDGTAMTPMHRRSIAGLAVAAQ